MPADDEDPATIPKVRGEPPPDDEAPVDQPTIPASGGGFTHGPPGIPPSRYELGEEIARGGMGRVVEAMDTQLGRSVALKEALALDPESLRRFRREITARASSIRRSCPSTMPACCPDRPIGARRSTSCARSAAGPSRSWSRPRRR